MTKFCGVDIIFVSSYSSVFTLVYAENENGQIIFKRQYELNKYTSNFGIVCDKKYKNKTM